MTTNELKVLSIIGTWGGEASIDIIAREAGVSIDYASLICRSLAREGRIDFLQAKLCRLKSKGKAWLAENPHGQQSYDARARKIVIPRRPTKFGLGKNKKGRLILNYG